MHKVGEDLSGVGRVTIDVVCTCRQQAAYRDVLLSIVQETVVAHGGEGLQQSYHMVRRDLVCLVATSG